MVSFIMEKILLPRLNYLEANLQDHLVSITRSSVNTAKLLKFRPGPAGFWCRKFSKISD